MERGIVLLNKAERAASLRICSENVNPYLDQLKERLESVPDDIESEVSIQISMQVAESFLDTLPPPHEIADLDLKSARFKMQNFISEKLSRE